jgi:hypothetical protein
VERAADLTTVEAQLPDDPVDRVTRSLSAAVVQPCEDRSGVDPDVVGIR